MAKTGTIGRRSDRSLGPKISVLTLVPDHMPSMKRVIWSMPSDIMQSPSRPFHRASAVMAANIASQSVWKAGRGPSLSQSMLVAGAVAV